MPRYLLRRMALCAGLIMLFAVPAKGQMVNGYMFSTGIDSTRWIDMTDAQVYANDNSLVNIGFWFYFCGAYHSRFSVDPWGIVYLDNPPIANHLNPFTQALPPLLAPYSVPVNASQVLWKMEGTLRGQVLVVEFRLSVDGGTRSYQVHLFERDGSVEYIYKPKGNTLQEASFQVGFMGANRKKVCVSQGHIPYDHESYWSTGVRDWPGDYRYYHFTPDVICGYPTGIDILTVSYDHAVVVVHPSRNGVGYELFYRCVDTGTVWQTVYSADTIITVPNLNPMTVYEYHVRAVCGDSSRSDTVGGRFRTICELDKNNRIQYYNLYDDSVVCRVGTFDRPSRTIQIVDDGYESNFSRHTVHYNLGETDPRTLGLLRTVPEGRCSSVRLGNCQGGAKEESITYTLRIDTNQYDLLILRYAIVEQDPGHSASQQPKFILQILDSTGRLIDNCYYANFVAGQGDSAWRQGGFGVVWRDWTAVGIDLTPLHGRTIYVMLDNYDCGPGGHYGYAYFTLESSFKRLQASFCGDADTNVFHAPKGFRYRWYKADRPNETLGTADSIVLTGEGVYKCRASFATGDGNCGMTLTANMGVRYPLAAFTPVAADSCGYTFRFENQSVIASDEARTQLTGEACEQYLWRFGDGTVSSAINPVHSFETGTYQVELLAMLANGQCRDSVSHTITVNRLRDTVNDTICVGGAYLFYGNTYTNPGFYSVTDGCWQHCLYLNKEEQYRYIDTIEGVICAGDTFVMGNRHFSSEGEHNVVFKSVEGCDSVCQLSLSVRPWPVVDYEVNRVCHGNTYYYLSGRYQKADSTWVEPGSVAFVGEDSLLYRWSTLSPGAPLPFLDDDGMVLFTPLWKTTYYATCQYMDSPACPVVDTIELDFLKELVADLEVSPQWLQYDQTNFTAFDRSRNALYRRWLVDGVEQDDTSSVFYGTASPASDSVRVGIVAYNGSCTDTALRSIPILRYMLVFPNVFTPTRASNNRFGPIGSNVTDYEIWIYDRRGALVFQSNDVAETWDGTCGGKICKQEAYTYVCRYTNPMNDRLEVTGTVTLLR